MTVLQGKFRRRSIPVFQGDDDKHDQGSQRAGGREKTDPRGGNRLPTITCGRPPFIELYLPPDF